MHLAPGDIPELLRKAKTVAIVGISDKPDRPSYGVANYLIENSHFDLFFVNPLLDEVLGQKVYKSLKEIDVHIDIVMSFANLQIAWQFLRRVSKSVQMQSGYN